MPNWCFTRMSVQGTTENLNEFLTSIKNDGNDETYDLNKLFPCPEGLQVTSGWFGTNEDGSPSEKQLEMDAVYAKNTEEFGYPSWYEWHNANYGSKWGACHISVDISVDDEIVVYFESAWSPCTGLIHRISELFPHLLFACMCTEESDDYIVWQVWRNGSGISGDMPSGDIINFYNSVTDWEDKDYETLSNIRNSLLDRAYAQMDKAIEEEKSLAPAKGK